MYDPENDRYCDTEVAKNVNCWSPSTSVKATAVPPRKSPPLVRPTFTGGRPSRYSLSNLPFFFCWSATRVCVRGAWKSTIGPGEPKSSVVAGVPSGSLRSSTCTL